MEQRLVHMPPPDKLSGSTDALGKLTFPNQIGSDWRNVGKVGRN